MSTQRSILLVINPTRPAATDAARLLAEDFLSSGFNVFVTIEIAITGVKLLQQKDLADCEIAVVLGGDGTMLRGAEAVRGTQIPLLGINLGHVGFLAEIERPSLEEIAAVIKDKKYIRETRMVVQYEVHRSGKEVATGWALNEVTIERVANGMLQLFVQIDGRPLSRWGCDGLICSTPTGSTAYAFSAGGPVVWPEVEALVLLPISAHALFAKPMVVSPQSEIVIDLESDGAILLGDSLRSFPLKRGDRVTVTKDSQAVALAHLNESVFTDRLVAKFKLPVEGWRGE